MSPMEKITLKNQANNKKYKNKNTTKSQYTKQNITAYIDSIRMEYIGGKNLKGNKQGFGGRWKSFSWNFFQ